MIESDSPCCELANGSVAERSSDSAAPSPLCDCQKVKAAGSQRTGHSAEQGEASDSIATFGYGNPRFLARPVECKPEEIRGDLAEGRSRKRS